MCLIKKLTYIIALITLVSCSNDHPNLEGQTTVRFDLAGSTFISNNDDSFTRVDESGLKKDIFIYAVDTVFNNTIDLKMSIDKTGLSSYRFQGDLYNSDSYIFVNNNTFSEFYAPHINGRSSGTIEITRNNGNRITGRFEVVTYDTETGLEELRLENGTFDFWY